MITQFTHSKFGEIRVSDQDGEQWFVAKDICDILEIRKHRDAIARLDPDERGSVTVDTLGGAQETGTINESGLYSLILRSNKPEAKAFKPEAKAFKKWVTSEVLPSIRKTGSYAAPSDDEVILKGYELMMNKVQALESKIEADKPKVEFHDTVTASPSVCQMAVAAQVAKLPFGRNTLFQRLREMGVLFSGGSRHNLPKQAHISRGLFTVEENAYEHPKSGETVVCFITHVTQKGVDWLINQFPTQEGSK